MAALSGTALKGTLELNKGAFTLKIYDNIKTVNRWKQPVIDYRSYETISELISSGVPSETAAFYGLEKVLTLVE
jgi:hypothetical protein